jgi:pyrimidine-specific ribonucleoside hydrolase
MASPRKTKSLIIDCDPGVDDALAILYAFSQKNRYTDITILTVAGNVGVNQTTANSLRLLALLQEQDEVDSVRSIKVRVIKGCATSMHGERPSAASVHGRDGMGEVPFRMICSRQNNNRDQLESAKSKIKTVREKIFNTDETAVGFLTSIIKFPAKYDLICTGPLTNIATALHVLGPDNYDAFWQHFNQVVIMGGALNVPGNITPFAEFNFFADPIAAKIVFDSWEKQNKNANQKLYVVPLDVTEKFSLRWEDIEPKEENGKVSHIHAFVTCMLQKYFFFHGVHASPVYWESQHQEIRIKLKRDNGCKRILEQSMRDDYRKKVADMYKSKKLGGSSGVKALFRFCYLHDPLAMYVNYNIDKLVEGECFTTRKIKIVQDLGETRGMSVDLTGRTRPIEALINNSVLHAEGTTAYVLDCDQFVKNHEETFITSLKDAIKS